MAWGRWRGVWVVVGVVAAAGWSAPVALAGLTSPLAFSGAVRADTQGLASLSCPSAQLCVGTDALGRIVRSVRPAGGPRGWRTQAISGPAGPVQLTQVDCASTLVCVAIGGDDEVARSTNPSAAVPMWQVAQVKPANPAIDHDLGGIACPSSSLCVVTDQEGDVITSADPASSQAPWTVSHVDQSTTYECVHYNETGCAPDLGPVSCPSSARCVALDFEGNELSSSDPAGGTSAWPPIGGGYQTPGTFWGYLTCARSLCLTAQFADSGIYAQPLTKTRPLLPVFTVVGEVSALTCPSASLCLAGTTVDGGPGRLYISPDPRSGAWRTVYSAAPGMTGGSTIGAISCPSTRLCFAADSTGRMSVGTPSPSQTRLATALRDLIRPRGDQQTIGRILKQHGERATLTAPLTGTLTIVWHQRPAGATHAHRHGGTVLAAVTTHLIRQQRATVLIKLTALGRRLLSRTTRRLALIADARLAPTSQPLITVTDQITLRPR